MPEFYNKYNESLDIDCCNTPKPPPPPKKTCGCNCGESLPSYDNTVKILISQLNNKINNLEKNTEKTLLCQNKKIAETMVYIKNNLANYLRDLFNSMIESGEIEQIIRDIFLDNNNDQ